MEAIKVPRAQVRRDADKVVEFLLLAFEERFLRWEASLNCSVAEMVWNAASLSPGELPLAVGGRDPAVGELIDALFAERHRKWKDETFLVFDVTARAKRRNLVFRFDLSWDQGASVNPCEITVDFPDATQLN